MADGIERMLVRWLDPESGTTGQGIVLGSDGKFHVTDLPGGGSGSAGLVPLTTVIGGVPDLVWDADNQLVMTKETP